MDYRPIRNEIRKMLVEATGIEPEKQLQIQGNFFPVSKKIPFWVQEYTVGGDISALTNLRNSSNSFIVQYNFVCHAGNGTDEIETAATSASEAIPPGTSFNFATHSAYVSNVKISNSQNEKFASVEVAFILTISTC